MCSFPYGRQVLLHIFFSLCASIFLGYAVFHCNFVEISNGGQNARGTSIGFWQTMDAFNGNFDSQGSRTCVPWTSEQAKTFDGLWNYGKYGGIILFFLSSLVTCRLSVTMFTELSPKTENRLAAMQFILSFFSILMLLALESNTCKEFDCWLDVGGVLTIAASVVLALGGWITLSLRLPTTMEQKPKSKAADDPTELEDMA